MPKVFLWNGYRFHFYSNEGDPLEPVHVHVTRNGRDAKFWLRPSVDVAYNFGFDARALRQLLTVIEQRRDEIEKAWHDHFTPRN